MLFRSWLGLKFPKLESLDLNSYHSGLNPSVWSDIRKAIEELTTLKSLCLAIGKCHQLKNSSLDLDLLVQKLSNLKKFELWIQDLEIFGVSNNLYNSFTVFKELEVLTLNLMNSPLAPNDLKNYSKLLGSYA